MKKKILFISIIIFLSISLYACYDYSLKVSESNIKDVSTIDFRDYYFNKPQMVYEYWMKDSKTGLIKKSHYIIQIVQGDIHNFTMYEQWINTNFNEVFTYIYHGNDSGIYLDSLVIVDPDKTGEESLIEPTITKNKALSWQVEMHEKYPNLTKAYVIEYYIYNMVNNEKIKTIFSGGLSYKEIIDLTYNNISDSCIIFSDLQIYSYFNDKDEKIKKDNELYFKKYYMKGLGLVYCKDVFKKYFSYFLRRMIPILEFDKMSKKYKK